MKTAIDVESYYKKYGPMVLRRCRYLLKNEEAAYDAMQDVFVELLNKADRLYHYAPSSLLYTIATNVCLNRMRKEKRSATADIEDMLETMAGWDNHTEKTEIKHFIDRLFSQEKESTRMIAVYHYVEKYTLEETAQLVNLSVSGVRKRLRQLREKSLPLKEV